MATVAAIRCVVQQQDVDVRDEPGDDFGRDSCSNDTGYRVASRRPITSQVTEAVRLYVKRNYRIVRES